MPSLGFRFVYRFIYILINDNPKCSFLRRKSRTMHQQFNLSDSKAHRFDLLLSELHMDCFFIQIWMTFHQTTDISNVRRSKELFKRIIDPHHFSGILLVENNSRIQHIKNLIKILMLDFLVHADTFIHIVNSIECCEQSALNGFRMSDDKSSGKISIAYCLSEIEYFFD